MAHQLGAVIDGLDLDARGQAVRVEFGDLLFDPLQHLQGVFTLDQKHDGLHHIVARVETDDTDARLRPDLDLCDILDPYRHPRVAGNDDLAYLLGRLEQTDTPYD